MTEVRRALARVLLPLHYRYSFTRAAAVDGSMDDPRREGGAQQPLLRLAIGRRQTRRAPVLPNGASKQHDKPRSPRIAEDRSAAPLAARKAVGSAVKRVAPARH